MIRSLFGAAFVLASLPVFGQALDENEQRMVEWIDRHAEDAIALLEETVNISSGTMNHAGIREVGRVMRRELDALGLESEWIEMPARMGRAGHLFGRKLDGAAKKFVLIGHLDTVFEADDAFTFVRPRTRLLRRRLDVEDALRHLEALFLTVKRRSGALVDDIDTI